MVKSLGYTQVTSLCCGKTHTSKDILKIKAVSDSPISPQLTENCYTIHGFS
ncbi:MAG: hypothetical protein ACQZ3N_01980 [cyanobacterium endosymbiont of Rhopalodia yunnanensis]